MCETANIGNIAVKVHILSTPTREYMRNSKHLTYAYKSAHIIFPDSGIYAKQETFEILLYESAHISYPDTGIYAKSKHLTC